MKRIGAMAVITLAVLAGCTGGTSGDTGTFELLVSDQRAAIDDFDSLTVTFSEARVFQGENESFETFDISDQQADLTQLQGARAQSLLNASLEAGTYGGVQLMASNVTGVVDGETVAVKLPSERLHITNDFTITPNATTRFVFDIQVVLRGNAQQNEGYILKPVISESGVVGEDVGEPDEVEDNGGDSPS